MEEKISIEEMKKIAREITESESKKYGIDINVRPVAFADIVKPDFFTNCSYTIDKRMKDFYQYSYLPCEGYNNFKGTMVVFVDKLLRSFVAKRISSIFMLANVCYHEARHSAQKTFDRYSYESFLRDIEQFYRKVGGNRDYKKHHDSYSFEIGANLYGVRMAREYLKKYNLEVYEKLKDKIDRVEHFYQEDYKMYNASYTIDRVLPIIKVASAFGDNEIVKHDFIKDTSPVLGIFLNGDGSFKKPSEVMNDERYQELDKRIVYAMFSSLSFLKDLKHMDNLTLEEINIINEAIDYTNTLCQMQMNSLNESKDKAQTLLNKLLYLKTYFVKYNYIKRRLNSFESNRELVNGKSRGYLSIYLLGLIISIGTIIYLYIKK